MTEKLGEKLAIERNRLFVGRNAELATAHRWVRNRNAPTQVWFVSGIGGIGKTSFMMRVLDLAMQADQRALWIDGRICTETPAGFAEALLNHLKTFDGLARHTASLQDLIQELSSGKTLLCVDNYDSIQKIDGWLREVFLPRLPSTGLLVLFVARPNLSESWLHDLAWRNRVSHIELPPLNKQEVTQYGSRIGFHESADIDRLLAESHGLPLALALMSEKLHLIGKEAWPVSLRISAELLREVTSPDLSETLDLLCILPQATPERLGRLLRVPLQAGKLLQLSRISFVRPTADGFTLHDVARHYLLEDFMRREPDRARGLRAQIVRELVRDIQSGDARDRSRLMSLLLSTCRDAFQLDSVSVFSQEPERVTLEPFQQSDLPELVRMLQEQAAYAVSIDKDVAVLQQMSQRFPGCIRVFRSTRGAPLAFMAGFYLYRETTRFHETHFPEVLEKAFPNEIDAMRTRSIEQADTFYHVLAAASDRDAEYSFHRLIGIMIADWLISRAAGLRVVIINTYEGITGMLLRLGYRMRPLTGLPDDHPFRHATVRELDWRASDIGERLFELLGIEPEAGGAGSVSPDNITEKSMIAALPLANDADRLAYTELAGLLGCTGHQLQQSMHRLLRDEPAYPLIQRQQQVLRLMHEAPHLTADAAADRLHVSRATYFRIRKDALQMMKEFLLRGGATS